MCGFIAEVREIVDDSVLIECLNECVPFGCEWAGSCVSTRITGSLVPCHPDKAESLGVPPCDFFGVTDRISPFEREQDLRSCGGMIEVFAVTDTVDDAGFFPDLVHGELAESSLVCAFDGIFAWIAARACKVGGSKDRADATDDAALLHTGEGERRGLRWALGFFGGGQHIASHKRQTSEVKVSIEPLWVVHLLCILSVVWGVWGWLLGWWSRRLRGLRGVGSFRHQGLVVWSFEFVMSRPSVNGRRAKQQETSRKKNSFHKGICTVEKIPC